MRRLPQTRNRPSATPSAASGIQRLLALAVLANPPRPSLRPFNQARSGPPVIRREKASKGSETRLEGCRATVVSRRRTGLVRYRCANAERRGGLPGKAWKLNRSDACCLLGTRAPAEGRSPFGGTATRHVPSRNKTIGSPVGQRTHQHGHGLRSAENGTVALSAKQDRARVRWDCQSMNYPRSILIVPRPPRPTAGPWKRRRGYSPPSWKIPSTFPAGSRKVAYAIPSPCGVGGTMISPPVSAISWRIASTSSTLT
jgi:hypothetical protein